MTHEKDPHLQEKEIIRAVVEESDLPESLREHLSMCDLCRAEKERLKNQLSLLGRTAERLAPSPGKKVTLPLKKASKIPAFWIWQWRNLLAAGLAAAMIIAVFLWKTPFPMSQEDRTAQWARQFEQDEQLMEEIHFLVENPLPQIYLDLSGESISGINDEFMEFVIPAIQNETLYNDRNEEESYVL